jgi:catechol-2,3-dioxygenase
MSTRGLCELALESRDHRALARFYQEALGLPLLADEDDRVWLACGPNARLGLWSAGEKEFGDRGGRHVHFAFSVPHGELDDIARRLRRLGTPSRGPVEHDGGDKSLYLEDPDGNLVEAWDFFENGDGANDGVAALT